MHEEGPLIRVTGEGLNQAASSGFLGIKHILRKSFVMISRVKASLEAALLIRLLSPHHFLNL